MTTAGYAQMGMPAAAAARACRIWVATGLDAKQGNPTFVDSPVTHRHRRPWGTS